MSPLAKKLAEHSMEFKAWWRDTGYSKLLKPYPEDVRFFDVTDVHNLTRELAQQTQDKGALAESVAFLPAPATWIEFDSSNTEYRISSNSHHGYLLVQRSRNVASVVEIAGFAANGGYGFAVVPQADLPLLDSADADSWALDSTLQLQGAIARGDKFGAGGASVLDWDAHLQYQQKTAYWLYTVLSMINSPKIIGRDERKPQSGLQRRLQRQIDRSFELRPWHVIKLDVTDPSPDREDGIAGARMTGPKAYHFCRSFLRIRLGKLERVRAHWRGDPALGISRGSYKLN